MMCRRIAALAALSAIGWAVPVAAATVSVTVTNVRNAKGVVHVELCHQSDFLSDRCPTWAEVPAHPGSVVVEIKNVPPGDYAIQAQHDENNNKRVDRALFGIPKEGIGFSNDAPIRMGPPKWRDATFALSGDKSLTLKMRYFLGPSGPAK